MRQTFAILISLTCCHWVIAQEPDGRALKRVSVLERADSAPEILPLVGSSTEQTNATAILGPESLEIRPLNSFGEVELRRFKRQPLQSVSITGGGLLDLGDSGLSGSYADFAIGSGVPLGSFENILGVKPRVRIDWLDAPLSLDVPSELYQFELQFFYRRPICERLSAMAIFSPSIRSDLTTDERAFRVFALALVNWDYIPDRLLLSGGAVFLGRADLPVLPAVGVTWTPTATTQLDLQFPNSRLSHRLAKAGGDSETWMFLSAGLGGNTWAVTRQSGQVDELSLRDYRFTAGLEKRLDGGGGWFVESGIAVGRSVEYERNQTERRVDGALLIQAGWRY